MIRIGLIALAAMLSACSPDNSDPVTTAAKESNPTPVLADTIYTNGRIYTVNEQQPWAEALAIRDGKLIAVGSNDEVAAMTGESTAVVDLGGKFVMPGFSDAHLHPPLVYIEEEAGNLLMDAQTADEVRDHLISYAEANPGDGWIKGEKWRLGAFPGGKTDRHFLDAIIPDRPVYLMDESGHNGVANTMALELAGITKDTPQPEGGAFEVDPETGEPTGYLSETGIRPIGVALGQFSTGEIKRAMERSLAEVRSLGVTSFIDMFAFRNSLEAYRAMEEEGNLTFRVSASIALNDYTDFFDTLEGAEETVSDREDFATDLIMTDSFKFWSDGTPLSYTSLMLEPYANNDTLGEMVMSTAQFERARALFDDGAIGRFHSNGDGGARVLLDLIEQYRIDHPESVQPMHLGHNVLVHADDIPRFVDLNVIAEFSPVGWIPMPHNPLIPEYVGEERAARWLPITQMYNAGVTVAIGSDWPAGTPTADPFRGLEGLVTRMDPWEELEGQFGEPAPLDAAIRMMTLNVVKAMHREHEFGSLEVGKFADMIILDQNLFEIDPSRISNTNVLKTIFNGQVVYDATKDAGPVTRLPH